MIARRFLVLGLASCGLMLCAASAPQYLRRLDAFRVRSVEVTGTNFLEPYEALAASGIDSTSSVFDDPRAWSGSLLLHPLVEDVRVSRRPPGTVRIHITEREPVALLRTPTLQPVDRRGQVLPVNPAWRDLDLPVLGGTVELSSGRVQDARIVRTLQGLASLRTLQPEMWPWISEVSAGGAHMRLLLRWPAGAELLLALPLEAERLDEVRLVLSDLAAGSPAGAAADTTDPSNDLTRLRRLDARFAEQVVVSLESGENTREGG